MAVSHAEQTRCRCGQRISTRPAVDDWNAEERAYFADVWTDDHDCPLDRPAAGLMRQHARAFGGGQSAGDAMPTRTQVKAKQRARKRDAQVRAVLYLRVSTDEQASNGNGLEAQEAALEAEATRRGWVTETITDAGVSGSTMDRPGLRRALDQLARGDADVLAVAKLDRLARSTVAFGTILENAKEQGWSLVSLDLGIDTSTAAGLLVANVMMSVAQWERQAIGERTSAALKAKAARGEQVGRRPAQDDGVYRLVVSLRDGGMTWQQVADEMNRDGFPTAQGGQRWYTSTAQAAYRTAKRRGF